MLEKLKEQGLNKNERLKSKKNTGLLFKNGDSLFSFPFKLVYKWLEEGSDKNSVQLLVSVPKKKFKNAVDRNLLRRRIKEAFRKNKTEIDITNVNKPLAIAIIYTHHEIRDFNDLQKRLTLILRKLNLQLHSNS